MRIWLRIPDDMLREAVADLLSTAGHEVSTTASPARGTKLCIVTESAPEDAAGSGAAVLVVGASAPSDMPRSPETALAAALESGGTVAWPSPLDPPRLLEVLSSGASGRSAPRRESARGDTALATSHDAWIRVDPRRRAVVSVNAAAISSLGLTPDDPSDALRKAPLAAFADAVVDQREGRGRIDWEGRPALVLWWTDEGGERVLGLLDVPGGTRDDPQGNLRTLAEIGRLSTTLAHEIRNPVAALAGALDLLEGDAEPVERAEVIALARQRLTQMKTLLDDTLRLARPFQEPPLTLEPDAVIRSALAGVRTDALFREIDLRVDLGAEPPTAIGHEEPLRQAITNLLLNAAQAQEGKGSITVRLTREDRWVVIRVSDDGPGIPPEKREKVFEPFWTTKTSGTGLGLSYVRRVAEASGGRVRVEEVPKGACFRIDLPKAT